LYRITLIDCVVCYAALCWRTHKALHPVRPSVRSVLTIDSKPDISNLVDIWYWTRKLNKQIWSQKVKGQGHWEILVQIY